MPLVDAAGGERGAGPLSRPHSPSGQSPNSGHPLLQNGEKVPVRAGRRAFGSPAGTGPLAAELDRLWRAKGTGKRRTCAGWGVWPWRWRLAGAAAGAARGWRHAMPPPLVAVMDLLPGQQAPTVGGDGAALDPLR